MTENDSYYYTLEIHDELMAQKKKLDKIVEQLEAQTKLQVGIFKQLYLLCQITSRDSTDGRYVLACASEELFFNYPAAEDGWDWRWLLRQIFLLRRRRLTARFDPRRQRLHFHRLVRLDYETHEVLISGIS